MVSAANYEARLETLEEEFDSAAQDLVDKSVEARLRGAPQRADLFLEAAVIVRERIKDWHTESQLSASSASPEGGPTGAPDEPNPPDMNRMEES